MKKAAEIRAKKPKTVSVNKPVVFTIVLVVGFFIIWAIIGAFSVSERSKPEKSLALEKNSADKSIEISPVLKELPENYNDVNGIKKYSSSMQGSSLSMLQREFEDLKTEHQMLEQQLLTMNQHPKSEQGSVHSDAQTEQAKTSNLFFSGVAPASDFGGGGQQSLFGASNTGQGSSLSSSSGSGSGAGPQQLSSIAPTHQQEMFFSKQNEDAQKLAVMRAQDNAEDIYDLHNVVTPVSPFEIQAGTIIPAVLVTAINTSIPGTVVAQIRQDVYDTVRGKFLLIPKGAKILGEYDSRVSYGQRRVVLTFNRLIRPDGSSILLGKPTGADLQGNSGAEGDVDNHWWRLLGAATISTILSVGAGVASDSYAVNGTYNAKQGAFLGASSGLSQVGQNIVNRQLDIAPTITLPAGYQFNLVVKKDMVLTQYGRH